MTDLPVPYTADVPDPYVDNRALHDDAPGTACYGRAPGTRMPAYAADKALAPCLVAGTVRDQVDVDAPHEFYDAAADKYVSFPRGVNPEPLFEKRQAIAAAQDEGRDHPLAGAFDPDTFVDVHAFKLLVGDWDIGFNIIADDTGAFYGIDHEWAGDYASRKFPDRVVRHFRGCAEQLGFDGEQPGMDELRERVAAYARQVDLDAFREAVVADPHLDADVWTDDGVAADIADAVAAEREWPGALLE